MPEENDTFRSEAPEGFILAGGRSARMGRDKAWLKFGEVNFLENAAEILRPVCRRVSVVLNRTQTDFTEKLPGGAFAVFDIFENRGAPGGIHTALKNCGSELAVILACDLPFVTSDVIAKLAGIALASEEFSAIVPVQPDGRLQPLCAIYRVADCLPKLEEILSKNASASVRDFLETIEIKTIRAADLSSDERVFANVNFPADLTRLIN